MGRQRPWTDARAVDRCHAVVTLRDKSKAQCGRLSKPRGGYCTQHSRILFACCGGNDEPITEHTTDCPKHGDPKREPECHVCGLPIRDKVHGGFGPCAAAKAIEAGEV